MVHQTICILSQISKDWMRGWEVVISARENGRGDIWEECMGKTRAWWSYESDPKPYSLCRIHQKIESWDEKEIIFELEESESAIEDMNIRETMEQNNAIKWMIKL